MIAEESTAWPGVTKPVGEGGLGFDLKRNMGWMHDSLTYISKDPVYRSYEHGMITFAMIYAYSERFMLPISHDEVVHGKGSLLEKMPGDAWQKMANVRAYLGFMWAHPGNELLFMGSEFAQLSEWNSNASLSWDLLDNIPNSGIQHLVRDLNLVYQHEPALQHSDLQHGGFEWAVADDAENSMLAMLRYGADGASCVLAVSNFTPVVRHGYRIGVPFEGRWSELLNSDLAIYGGSGLANHHLHTTGEPGHGRPVSLSLSLPALSTIYLRSP